jgi:5-bromo-4-chloroindolyl phosphate hydrolysis protein
MPALPAVFRGASVWVLRVMALTFILPLILHLLRGAGMDALSLIAGIALFLGASSLIRAGLDIEADFAQRRIARPPRLPRKLAGAVVAGLGAAAISLGAAQDGVLVTLVFGCLTAFACFLAYGSDPRADDSALDVAAKRAGVAPKEVRSTIDEASRKIRDIEAASAQLNSRELKAWMQRITDQARVVLGQLETDPKDLPRARRFLVTYLDGTRDVVAKYAAQQHDLADTPLAENFRRVLTTIEQVFKEQEEVLKQDDKTDLEIQIEVLETQLKREGVH